MRSIEFRIIWESMLWHVVTKGAVRGCCNVAILNFKHCYVAFWVNAYVPRMLVYYYFLFPICCCNFNKHWFRTFITISYLACHRFNYVACWNLPWQDLLQYPDEALLDYFMLDHDWHILNLMLQVLLRKKNNTRSGQGNMVAIRLITSFTH